ncbi:MaoC family dehydratase [Streptomyces sp. NPDC088794]|uniref:MaoC family dehydratase n=1 Tax=Streptomyces sp. NPDC088794 TaxID=3365902 RepID=UPI0038145961
MSVVLAQSPALTPLLARGALLSPFKRPRPDAEFPHDRLVLAAPRIDLARLAAYERVCGFATGDDALPLTYPHVLGFPLAMRLMSRRDFPLPLLGLVHTSIDITRPGPLLATGEYELAVRVEGLAPHRRGTEATVVTELRGGGEVVWGSRSTYLARHRGSGGDGEKVERTASRADGEGRASGDRAPYARGPGQPLPAGERRRSLDDAPDAREPLPATGSGQGRAPSAGATAEGPIAEPLPAVAEWQLAGDVGRRYGAVSGDRNPIHLHPLTARLFGFPRAIAHGMWTVARCLAAHGTPDAVRVRAEFRAPVLLPGTVTYAAEGGRFELRGDEERVHVSGTVTPLGS